MHIKKVNKFLKKINNLHQSFLEDDDIISKIEKELFLSYIKNLYIAVADGDDNFEELKPRKVKSKEKKNATVKNDIVVEESISEIIENPILEELIEKKTEVVDSITEESVIEDKIVEREPKIEKKELVEPIPVIVQPVVEVFTVPSEMDSLFEKIEVKELSAKLANAPIKSIKSKLGINEKLLTVTELFSKDQEQFNITIAHLDSLTEYDDAKIYLSKNVVNQFDWLSDKKIKKAIRFVQLVQRRYL